MSNENAPVENKAFAPPALLKMPRYLRLAPDLDRGLRDLATDFGATQITVHQAAIRTFLMQTAKFKRAAVGAEEQL